MKKKMFLTITIIAAMLLSTVLSGCGNVAQSLGKSGDLMKGITVDTGVSDQDMEEAFSKGGGENYCNFAVEFFKTSALNKGEVSDEDSGNLLLSPLSVIYAMSMVSNGAEGMTRTQLLTALTEGKYSGEIICGTSSTGEGDIYDEFQDNLNNYLRAYMNLVINRLSYDEKNIKDFYGSESKNMKPGELHVANSIWFKKDPQLKVEKDFLEINGKYYNAGIRETEFNEAARRDINKWIEENTGGMIKDMLKEIPEEAIMYLINALAFEGSWEETYEDYQVEEGEFFGESQNTKVEFMTGSENNYLEDELATGFIKPYMGYHYGFVGLLPNEGVSLDEYIDSLTGENIHNMIVNRSYSQVIATMPKFEEKSSLNLVETFKTLGVIDAFDINAADFSKLGSHGQDNIRIGRILHDTYINVDENGTKAGAATIVEMLAESAMEGEYEPPKVVTLDRPFVYMLVDLEQGIPLFIGAIRDL